MFYSLVVVIGFLLLFVLILIVLFLNEFTIVLFVHLIIDKIDLGRDLTSHRIVLGEVFLDLFQFVNHPGTGLVVKHALLNGLDLLNKVLPCFFQSFDFHGGQCILEISGYQGQLE